MSLHGAVKIRMADYHNGILDGIQILAGCDYLDSIPGIGIKTAHKLLRKHKSVEKASRHVCTCFLRDRLADQILAGNRWFK